MRWRTARVAGVDISEGALRVTRENARRLGVQSRYVALKADVRFRPPNNMGQFDILVSNPPYVTRAEMRALASRYAVPILRTTESTSNIVASLVAYLNVELAPRITRHGVLVEVYGEGILLVGDSGVGKSETAVELIKRGHRLVADDAVELRKITAQRISGTSPDNIRHFLELRGIGIINARRIFGMGAIKSSVDVDLIVNLELWDDNKVYDRMGMEDHYTDILGVQVPSITIPVKPGRNIAVILEVAAMNYREKKLGYNAAYELLQRLGMMDIDTNWDTF